MLKTEKAFLSPAWRESITFGVLWGGIEITLGAFLHTLQIPFSGFFLSLAGILILVSGYHIFPRHGFCVRAGLICAGIKCFGPAGMIIGPMIGILTESILIELALFIPSRKMAAFLAGALAVSWPISQQILRQVLFFGGNILKLYLALFKKMSMVIGFSEQAGMTTGIGIFLFFVTLGALVGLLGLKIGLRAGEKYWTEEIA